MKEMKSSESSISYNLDASQKLYQLAYLPTHRLGTTSLGLRPNPCYGPRRIYLVTAAGEDASCRCHGMGSVCSLALTVCLSPDNYLTHLVSQAQHDSMFLTRVWHASVPSSQVANNDIALATHGLHRWMCFDMYFLGLFRNGWQRVVHASFCVRFGVLETGRHGLIAPSCVGVRSQPELGGAIFEVEIAKGNVGDEVVWELGVLIASVFVYWLTDTACFGQSNI